MNNGSESESAPFGIEAALLLALLTAATYIVGYRYESSFCEHFVVPEYFIRLSPEMLTSSFLSISAFAMSVFWVVHWVARLIVRRQRDPSSFVQGVLVYHAVLVAIGAIFGLTYGFTWKGTLIFLAFIGLVDLAIVIWAVAANTIGTWWQRKFPRAAPVPTDQKIDGFTLLFRYVKGRYVIAILVVWAATLIADFAGIQAARSQTTFPEILDAELVVIRNYGDYVVCKQVLGSNLGAATFLMKTEALANRPIAMRTFKRPPEIEKVYRPTPKITESTI